MRKLVVILSLVLGGLIVLAQRIGFPPVTNTTGGGGTNYTFNSGQFTIISSTNVNFKVGITVTNLTDNGNLLAGTTNIAGALALKAPITNAALVTPDIGVATGTSLAVTGTLTGNNLVISNSITLPPLTVAYASVITNDFTSAATRYTVLDGDITISSSNLGVGRGFRHYIANPKTTNCNIILPSGWRFLSGVVTNVLAASKIGHFDVFCLTATDTNTICSWFSE